MGKRLKNIEVEEVSLVESPATRKHFLFAKADGKVVKLELETNGTIGGTKVVINGMEIANLNEFVFSFWDGDPVRQVTCFYTIKESTQDGFSRLQRYDLTKGAKAMDKRFETILAEFVDTTRQEELSKNTSSNDQVVQKIEEAAKVIKNYKQDFPDDLNHAIGAVLFYACHVNFEKAEESEEKETPVAKAGAKFSRETMAAIQKAIAALQALREILPEETDKTAKQTTQQTASLEQKLLNSMENLDRRLKKIEETTGVKKSIEGQEGDDDNDGDNKDEKVKWPSLLKT